MPTKKTKLKIPFKKFSADNYSRFASKFPFLKERQIKAKLHQAWRKHAEDNREADTPKVKKRCIETVTFLSKGESNGADRLDEKCHSNSTLKTYSKDQCHKRKAQAAQTTSTVNKSQSSQSSVTCSATHLDAKEGSKKSFPNQTRKTTELRGLFKQIPTEQLFIEPVEKYQDNDQRFNNLSSFYSHRELKGASQDLQQEKGQLCVDEILQCDHSNEQDGTNTWGNSHNCKEKFLFGVACTYTIQCFKNNDTSTVSGMFKWRADRKRNSQHNKDENNATRFLVSNEREGDSNFQSMFADDEVIFA